MKYTLVTIQYRNESFIVSSVREKLIYYTIWGKFLTLLHSKLLPQQIPHCFFTFSLQVEKLHLMQYILQLTRTLI